MVLGGVVKSRRRQAVADHAALTWRQRISGWRDRSEDWLKRTPRSLVIAVLAIVAAAGVIALVWPITDLIATHDVGLITGRARAAALQAAREAVRTQLLTLGAGVFAAGALIYTARNFSLAREGQVTDRYTKAIEQLGSEKELHVRIGGIYALERLARDSARDHVTVMEVLAAFIRDQSLEQWPTLEPGAQSVPLRTTRPDVQAAITVIGRRDARNDRERIDLTGANLSRGYFLAKNIANADLSNSVLVGANFWAAWLVDTWLSHADLSDADLTRAHAANASFAFANLTRADFHEADLTAADLSSANLREAKLVKANLTRTDFSFSHLNGAYLPASDFTSADLTGVDFSGAILPNSKLSNLILVGVNFTQTDLTGVDFTGTRFDEADFTGVDLSSANVTGAEFSDTKLAGAKLPQEAQAPQGWARDRGTGLLKPANEVKGEPGGASNP
jgi:uncharacterized protein with PIN domain